MAKLLGQSKSLRQLRNDAEKEDWPQAGFYVDSVERPATSSSTRELGARPSPTISLASKYQIGAGMTNSSKSSLLRPKTATDAVGPKRTWAELTATGSPIILSTAEDTFKFPTPARNFVANSPAVRSFDMVSETSSGIGIAIGSPSQPSFLSPTNSSKWAASSQDFSAPVSPWPARANTTKETVQIMDGSRPKLSRWKSLGGLFGRKRAASPNAFGHGQVQAHKSQEKQEPLPSGQAGSLASMSSVSSLGSDSMHSPGRLRKTKLSLRSRKTPVQSPSKPIPVRQDSLEPLSAGPLLDVDIPDVRLERYSVMFSEVLPRSSSLLARRQAVGDKTKPVPGGLLKTLEIAPAPGKLVRRATVPSPTPSPSYNLFPRDEERDQNSNDAHISTLYRPRPLRRSRTSPSYLTSPNPQAAYDGGLSPAFEVDEMGFDENENGLTPTPSTPASPSTPEFGAADGNQATGKSHRSRHSWTNSRDFTDPSWQVITVGKAMESGDLLDDELLREDDIDDEEWLANCKPQVAVARSMSVTKTNRKKIRVKQVAGGTARGVALGISNHTDAPPSEVKKEIQKEIFGDRGIGGTNEKIVEKTAFTPTMHHVVDVGSRKSVWGLIESV